MIVIKGIEATIEKYRQPVNTKPVLTNPFCFYTTYLPLPLRKASFVDSIKRKISSPFSTSNILKIN
jgi:hypothetical protein